MKVTTRQAAANPFDAVQPAPATRLVYAKVFGPTYGKAKPQKLHHTADGETTLCGLACYRPGSAGGLAAWTDVCGRCQKIAPSVK